MAAYPMKRLARLMAACIVLFAAMAGPVAAEEGDATTVSFSYTPLYQFETDMDSGGDFDVQRHLLRFNVRRMVDRHWMVGLGLKLDYEAWDFSGASQFAGVSLWDEVVRQGLSLPIFYLTDNWQFGLIPSLEFAGTDDADTDESLVYGAVATAGYTFGPDLTIGIGGGLFEELDQTEFFPFLVIDWQISDNWRLTNPFEAGPVGPAGLEIVYTPVEGMRLGIGGAYRSSRFRLADSASVADGIGEVSAWAGFVRLGWQMGENWHLDINGGAMFDGEIVVEDRHADELGKTDYDTAPFVGLTVRGTF